MNREHGEIIIYQAEDGQSSLEVHLQKETVWLTQEQMAQLFGKTRSTVNEHIKNIFSEGELLEDQVMRKFGNSEFSTKPTNFYNLDVVISVGYRVKSQRGTQFRIWAANVLKQHLIRGYTTNERRLAEKGLAEMEEAIALLARTWSLLLQYDEDRLALPPGGQGAGKTLDYNQVKTAITTLKSELLERGEAGELFGQERANNSRGFSAISIRPSALVPLSHPMFRRYG